MEISKGKKIVAIILLCVLSVIALFGIATCISVGVASIGESDMPKDYVAYADVKFIAHRGLSSEYYESSEEAFLAAAESDFFYGIETDVYFTSDGVAVCSHDNAAFEDKSVKITSSTYDQIKDLRLKENSYGLSGSLICTFERYLEICAEYDKAAIIELKQTSMTETQIKTVVDTAKSICGDNFVIIGFSRNHLEVVENIDSSIVTQHLVIDVFSMMYSLWSGYNISSYQIYLSETLVTEAHSRGRQIGVWTVNDIDDAKRYAGYGVDYITTDYDFSAEW